MWFSESKLFSVFDFLLKTGLLQGCCCEMCFGVVVILW
ncbi:hypothetical protein ECDEC10B_3654 [Escherichia coli DEC10B]|nr:hypothetical protein FORC28_1616 [Escherichia coli]EHW15555.1 hypothetical protein ECDEC8C_3768 [Escherichia coli DEC8C]EHW67146.1 hypothetical protein ECDEC10B_3654 [Escherichia coli DEC10B]EHW72236.1 hypothetical protein ECDEC10C_3744 [Escherichia coli DEC10C]EKI51608.1 hypothetical protein ECN1_2481 [Escherichia coli N1]EZK21555.1 hypothetical protein AB26_2757 [Escherichia coli 2-011-08_S1_C2]